MEAFAEGPALDAVARAMIEMVETGLQLHCKLGRRELPLEGAPIQSVLEIADALFHGAICRAMESDFRFQDLRFERRAAEDG